jgi:hypothetical protein
MGFARNLAEAEKFLLFLGKTEKITHENERAGLPFGLRNRRNSGRPSIWGPKIIKNVKKC